MEEGRRFTRTDKAARLEHHDHDHGQAEDQHAEQFGREIRAEDRLEEGELAQDFRAATMTTAATAMPISEPMPPRTTMARMTADSRKTKLSGETKP